MIVHKNEITSRVRFYAFGVFILLIMMAGCDSITSPDATTDIQSAMFKKTVKATVRAN
jgi:hypothetical protein